MDPNGSLGDRVRLESKLHVVVRSLIKIITLARLPYLKLKFRFLKYPSGGKMNVRCWWEWKLKKNTGTKTKQTTDKFWMAATSYIFSNYVNPTQTHVQLNLYSAECQIRYLPLQESFTPRSRVRYTDEPEFTQGWSKMSPEKKPVLCEVIPAFTGACRTVHFNLGYKYCYIHKLCHCQNVQ